MQQGLDIVSPLFTDSIHKKFVFATTNYFTKWMKVESYVPIKDKKVKTFV